MNFLTTTFLQNTSGDVEQLLNGTGKWCIEYTWKNLLLSILLQITF